MTPLKVIRLKCRGCAGSAKAVEACDFTNCGLWYYRFGHRAKDAPFTPVRTIRKECLDCCRGSFNEVALCPVEDCPLFPFRFGRNPNIHLTDEQKAERASRFTKKGVSLGTQTHNDPSRGRGIPI